MEKIKLVVRRILIVLLVIWMIVVFGLSNQNGEESSNLSRKVANFFANGDTVKAENIEPVVRKVAHMTEYAVGAMLFYGITMTYSKYSQRARIFATIGFILLYASSDEIHQYYISDRRGTPIDVFIDLVGAVMGIGALYIIETSINVIDNKVKENVANN